MHRQLHPRDDPDIPRRPGCDRLRESGERVVVGHREDRHPRRRGEIDQRRRRQRPVRGDGVGVEIRSGNGRYAEIRPRDASSAITVAALSCGVCDSVVMCTSGFSGAS